MWAGVDVVHMHAHMRTHALARALYAWSQNVRAQGRLFSPVRGRGDITRTRMR
jgi:hypothetical protein